MWRLTYLFTEPYVLHAEDVFVSHTLPQVIIIILCNLLYWFGLVIFLIFAPLQ